MIDFSCSSEGPVVPQVSAFHEPTSNNPHAFREAIAAISAEKRVRMSNARVEVCRSSWIEELRNREPNDRDLATIQDLHKKEWKAPAIACGLELNVKTVRKVIRNLA